MSQSVERALDVLTAVADEPATPAAIARRLDVHRSTALRIVELLAERGLLRKLADGRYGIGPTVVSLATKAAEQFDLARVAHPYLLELSDTFGQTAHLAELQGDHIVYIDKVDPRGRSIQLTSRIGQRAQLHTASVAKAILAFQSPRRRDELLRDCDYRRFTERTLTNRNELDAALDTALRNGWATDAGELEDYINAVAVPIRDASGAVIAALSLVDLKVARDLVGMERDELSALCDAAREISTEIGWTPTTSEGT